MRLHSRACARRSGVLAGRTARGHAASMTISGRSPRLRTRRRALARVHVDVVGDGLRRPLPRRPGSPIRPDRELPLGDVAADRVDEHEARRRRADGHRRTAGLAALRRSDPPARTVAGCAPRTAAAGDRGPRRGVVHPGQPRRSSRARRGRTRRCASCARAAAASSRQSLLLPAEAGLEHHRRAARPDALEIEPVAADVDEPPPSTITGDAWCARVDALPGVVCCRTCRMVALPVPASPTGVCSCAPNNFPAWATRV